MIGGPGGLAAFLLFCNGLNSQVRAQQQVFIVEQLGSYKGYSGLYAEEGQGSTKYYKRLGGESSKGHYLYLYRGTERRGTWVIGYGRNFEGKWADFRAPAGSAGEDAPPERGWQWTMEARTGERVGRTGPTLG